MQRLRLRSAALSGFPELARSLGLDPAALARQAGLRLASLASPDVLIPARAAYRLMELAAAASGAEDVGLRLARRRGLSHLGMLGLLARDEADVGAALRRIIVGMNLHSNCVTLDLREDDDVAMLTLEVLPDGEPVIRQSTEAGLGLLFQILVALLGPQWRPLQVQFVHARGASDRPHRALFGCPVRFSLDSNAVFLRRADLARPVPGADAGFRRFAPSAAAAGQAPDGRITPERVRQAMRLLLPGGACTSTAVAARLGVDRRTLHRHLARADTDFSGVLQALRLELAQEYLDAGGLSATDIGQLLGFNATSAFSRWFRASFGVPPTHWRTRQPMDRHSRVRSESVRGNPGPNKPPGSPPARG